MLKSSFRLLPVAAFVMGVFLSSCKDDEPTKYQLAFAEDTRTVNEADGDIEVEIKLDKPAPQDIEIEYTITGTAFDEARAQQEQDVQDFEITDDDPGEITIEKGETSAKINISLFSDGSIEDPETIILTLDKVNNTNVQFEAGEKIEITVNQEDGVVVVLQWPSAGVNGVADMDMFMKIGSSATAWEDGYLTYSAYHNFTDNFEFVFLPKVVTGDWLGLGYVNTTFGLTYTYYDGTLNPLNFSAIFIDVVNGDLEPEGQRQTFQASYTAVHKNKWTNASPPSIIAQTFTNNGSGFGNYSQIVVGTAGSRIASGSGVEKVFTAPSRHANPNFTARVKKLTLPQRFKTQLGLH